MNRSKWWQDNCHFEDSMSSTVASTAREVSLKLLVLGDAMVGKTSLVQRYVNNVFRPSYKETIGVDFTMKVMKWTPRLTLKLQFWDIAGNERLGAITRAYYRNADGCVLMFDLTDHSTFYRVSCWKEDLDSKCRRPDGSPLPCLLLGNKSDIANEWSVNRDDIQSLSRRYGFCSWRGISVKENIGVDEAVSFLLRKMLDQASDRGGTESASYRPSLDSDSIVLGEMPAPQANDSCPC